MECTSYDEVPGPSVTGMDTRAATQREVAGLTVTEWPGSTGPVVLGLPGLGSSGGTWRPLAEELPEAHLVSVDLRGRGDGQGMAGPTGLRAHARDVAAVLTELDLRDVVVVGHSMGAYLAPLVAQEAPERVRKLVLVDGGIRPAFPFFMTAALTRLVFRRELRSMDRDWPSVEAMAAKGKVGRMVAGRPELEPLVLQMLVEQSATTPAGLRPRLDVERAVADAVDTFWGDDVVGALEAVQVPVELLLAENMKWDGQKPFIADKVVQPWRDRLPNLTVTRLKGNHVTVLFDPAVVAAVGTDRAVQR